MAECGDDGLFFRRLRVGEQAGSAAGVSTACGRWKLPSETLVDVIGRLDKSSHILLNEIITPLALLTPRETRHGEDLPIIVERVSRRYEATALLSSLDDKSGIGKARDNPVARDEIVGLGLSAECEFRDDSSVGDHLRSHVAMLGWVESVKAMGNDSHGGPASLERGTVSRDINAEGQTRDNDKIRVALAKVGNDALAEDTPLVGGLTGADDGENLCRLEIDSSLAEKHDRRIGTVGEARGIVVIRESEHSDVETLGDRDLGLGERESLGAPLENGGEEGEERRREIRLGSGEDGLGRAEMLNELAQSLRTYAIDIAKRNDIGEIGGHQVNGLFYVEYEFARRGEAMGSEKGSAQKAHKDTN